jgi:glycosyltransferase involved in cell wall biosynthesis
MRVALVVPGFSANQADWCIPALRHLARQLARTDDVRVLAVRYPYRAARYAVDGVEVIALGGAERRGASTLEVWRTTLGALRDEHRRCPFDVLHAFWATESGLLAAIAGRLLRVPTLISLAGGELVALPDIAYGDQRRAWERLKVAACLRLASTVSAGSRQLAGLAERRLNGKRVYRAPLGVDLDLFSSEGAAATDAPRIVHVGTLTGVKDQAMLLRAFARLSQHVANASLDVVGDGPLRPRLEELAHALGVAESVRFLGDADHAALPPVYRSAKVFALSSRHEAQGMVAIEAAACGLPVVGTAVGIVPELTDAMAAVGADEALAAALGATLDNPAPAAHAALAHARADLGLVRCTDRFRDLYARLPAA